MSLSIIRNSEKIENPSQVLNSQNVTAQIFVLFENSNDGDLSINKSNVHNMYLESAVVARMDNEFKFKSVVVQPTKYEQFANPEKYQIDYNINVSIKEKVIEPESGWGKFLRVISLGFYSQKMNKSVVYKIEVIKSTTNNKKVVSLDSTTDSTYEYTVPMLIIPLNLDDHPFYYEKQMVLHEDAIINLMKKGIQ